MQTVDKEIGSMNLFNQREDRVMGSLAEIDETKDKYTEITSV